MDRLSQGRRQLRAAKQKRKLPNLGVSLDEARRYAAWKTVQAKEEENPFVFAIPNELHRAKAANGADGRPYPWGGTFIPGYPAHRSRRNAVRVAGVVEDQTDKKVGCRLIAK